MKVFWLSLLFILSFCFTGRSDLHGQSHMEGEGFHPPVNIPLRLSGNFGELRSNHFHAGIDIKTRGTTGQKTFAIAGGYVSRIKVSSGGYGRAIYIHHPHKGLTSVYGHLKQFSPAIEAYVTDRQYEKKSFEIQLFPKKDQFPVERGSLIGWSGNSGSSEGPHVHFEIRNLSDQEPLNPLRYDFDIRDNIPPKIFNLAVYPLGKNASVNGTHQKQIFRVIEKTQDRYALGSHRKISLHGKVGFGLRAFDFLNGAPNWCGLYTVKLFVDSTLMYHHQMDRFAFHQTRYINSLIDYEEKIKNDRSFQQSFRKPNNPLPIYEYLRNKGIYHFSGNTRHTVTYQIADVYGNTSRLSFTVESLPQKTPGIKTHHDPQGKCMPFNQSNSFVKEDIRLNFPKNAFYDTLYFQYHKDTAITGSNDSGAIYSAIHQVHNRYTPVHKSYNLSIQTKDLPEILENKAFIARIDPEDDSYRYMGGEPVNGFISTQVRSFGKFAVMVDQQKPHIEPLVINQEKISFKIDDELSGIDRYNGYLNGRWVLFEYDPKNDKLTYHVDHQRLKKADRYNLELYISDAVGNMATYHDTLQFE